MIPPKFQPFLKSSFIFKCCIITNLNILDHDKNIWKSFTISMTMIIILTEKVLKIVNTISLIDFYTSHADYSIDNNVAVCCCLTNYTKPHHDTTTTTWSWCKSWPEYELCQQNILSSALQYKVTWYQQPTGTNMALCMYI